MILGGEAFKNFTDQSYCGWFKHPAVPQVEGMFFSICAIWFHVYVNPSGSLDVFPSGQYESLGINLNLHHLTEVFRHLKPSP